MKAPRLKLHRKFSTSIRSSAEVAGGKWAKRKIGDGRSGTAPELLEFGNSGPPTGAMMEFGWSSGAVLDLPSRPSGPLFFPRTR
jgi:hypothetical protein